MLRIFADCRRVEIWTGKGTGSCPREAFYIPARDGSMRSIAEELGKETKVHFITQGGYKTEIFEPKKKAKTAR